MRTTAVLPVLALLLAGCKSDDKASGQRRTDVGVNRSPDHGQQLDPYESALRAERARREPDRTESWLGPPDITTEAGIMDLMRHSEEHNHDKMSRIWSNPPLWTQDRFGSWKPEGKNDRDVYLLIVGGTAETILNDRHQRVGVIKENVASLYQSDRSRIANLYIVSFAYDHGEDATDEWGNLVVKRPRAISPAVVFRISKEAAAKPNWEGIESVSDATFDSIVEVHGVVKNARWHPVQPLSFFPMPE